MASGANGNAGPSLVTLLSTAQTLIGKKDYAGAFDAFTQLLDAFPQLRKTSPLPLISRAMCAMELEKFDEAFADAMAAKELPDSRLPNEIIGGCFNTRAAAVTIAARVLNDTRNPKHDAVEAAKLAKEVHESNMGQATATLKSNELKQEGNELFKLGKHEEALGKYQESVKVDDTNAESWGNMSVVLGKLGKWKEAEEAATTATQRKPGWSKAWYRLGMALMSQKRFADATSAFHTGITVTPKGEEVEADLKRRYAEAARLSEKEKVPARDGHGGQEDALPKRMMGMLQVMRQRSWDVRQFTIAADPPVAFPSLSTVFSRTAPTSPSSPAPFILLSNQPAALQQTLARAMRSKFKDFVLTEAPVSALHRDVEETTGRPIPDKRPHYDLASPESYLLIHHPLVTSAFLFHLFSLSGAGVPSGPRAESTAQGGKKRPLPTKPDWQVVFTLNFSPPPQLARALGPIYAALVDRSTRVVVDWMSWPLGLPEGTLWKAALGQQAHPGGPGEPSRAEAQWHVCDNLGEMLELIEEVYIYDARVRAAQTAQIKAAGGHAHDHQHGGHSHDHDHGHEHSHGNGQASPGGHDPNCSGDHDHGDEEPEYEYPADSPVDGSAMKFVAKTVRPAASFVAAHPGVTLATVGMVLFMLLSAFLDAMTRAKKQTGGAASANATSEEL